MSTVVLWRTIHTDRDSFFYAYRDVACTIYPVVPDTDEFEKTLEYMLESRARYQRDNIKLDQTMPLGISLSYLALVFAVMASGAQCTSLRAKERELTSQVYSMSHVSRLSSVLLTDSSLLLVPSATNGQLHDASKSRDH